MKWTGSLTLEKDGKEDAYSPGSSMEGERYAKGLPAIQQIQAESNFEGERYPEGTVELKMSSSDNRGIATVRLTEEDCKNLIKELAQRL